MKTGRWCRSIWLCFLVMTGCNPDSQTEDVKGILTDVQGITVLSVWGTPYEQGYAQGYLTAETIVDFMNQSIHDLGQGAFVQVWQNEVLPNLYKMTIPQTYADELRGILHGMEAKMEGPVYIDGLERNLTYEDLVGAQCNEDILKMQSRCASFCVWGPMTADGQTITGRNYDHQDRQSETDFKRIVVRSALSGGEMAWVSFCGPAEIGCTTGINEEGVTISQHDGQEDFSSMNASDTIYPDGLVHRRAIETARSASAENDVTTVFKRWAIASSCIPMVTWPHSYHGPASVVYEMDSDRAIDGGVTVRDVEGETPYQITANNYRERPSQAIPDYRYDLLDSRLSSIAASGGIYHVDLEYAWQLLGEVPANPDKSGGILVYSVVFEPDKMRMHVAVSKNGEHAPSGEKVSLDIAELLVRVQAEVR